MFRKITKEQLKVPAHIDYLSDLREFISQIGINHNISEKVINAFKLAVDEAVTNIIRHSYRDEEGFIILRAFIKKKSLAMCIIDQGTFFDPRKVKDPDLKKYVEIKKRGGLGIFIMRKLMDEIDYRKTREGNVLRITKNRKRLKKTNKFVKLFTFLGRTHNAIKHFLTEFHSEPQVLNKTADIRLRNNRLNSQKPHIELPDSTAKSADHSVGFEHNKKDCTSTQVTHINRIHLPGPISKYFDFAILHEEASEVMGNYYDSFEMGNDFIGIFVADCGNIDLRPSFKSLINTTLHTEARNKKNAANRLAQLNTNLAGKIQSKMSIDMLYLVIDLKKYEINYAVAGDVPVILHRVDTQQSKYLNRKGFQDGSQISKTSKQDISIDSDKISLSENDIFIIHTNGLTNRINSNQETFSKDRLLNFLKQNGQLPINKFADELKNEINAFTEGNVQVNDLTFIALRKKSIREQPEHIRAKEAHRLILNGKSIRESCELANLSIYVYYNKYKKTFAKKVEEFERNADDYDV